MSCHLAPSRRSSKLEGECDDVAGAAEALTTALVARTNRQKWLRAEVARAESHSSPTDKENATQNADAEPINAQIEIYKME